MTSLLHAEPIASENDTGSFIILMSEYINMTRASITQEEKMHSKFKMKVEPVGNRMQINGETNNT